MKTGIFLSVPSPDEICLKYHCYDTAMNDSDFDQMLRSAKREAPLPASFRHGVWQRIENDAAEIGTSWYQGVLGAVFRPWGTAVGLAATIVLGLWLGAVSAPAEKSTLATYADSISPFHQSHR
jgi:hypothetical protein